MGLSLTNIAFRNYRNYETFELDKLGPLTIFVGPNAVGKTNVIEGIQLLTSATSFRHPKVAQLVRRQSSAARIKGMVSDGERKLLLSLDVADGKRHHAVNGKTKRPADLKGLLPSVVFTPDDLDLVKGPRQVRLAALDNIGSQLSANHYLIKRDYEKVIRYKNRLLKEDASDDLIASIDEMLITCGAQLTCYRFALFEKLMPFIVSYYATLSNERESLTVSYLPSWISTTNDARTEIKVAGISEDISSGAPTAAYYNPLHHQGEERSPLSLSRNDARDALAHGLALRRAEERRRRRALVGPHADHLDFYLDGYEAGVFGSQGQQRSIVLAFKLAEVALIRDMLGKDPLLLLDDVMGELDDARREALVASMSEGTQTFITTTSLSSFSENLLTNARIVDLPYKFDVGSYEAKTPPMGGLSI